MIIFGTRGMNSRLESGSFHCPRCGNDKSFELIAVKRWFTLYFIPVIPLGEAGRYVECKSCAGTFDERVRDYDPEAENARFKAEFENAMLLAMIAMAKADGVIDPEELETIADVMTKLSGQAYEVDEIEEAVDSSQGQSLDAVLRQFSGTLSANGKVMVIHALCLVAKADGEVADSERNTVYRAGKLLGIRNSDVDAFLLDES